MERPKIDFARIKREVLVVDVARRYGVDLRGKDKWLHGKCPLPTHESKDSKSSFAVNVAENYWLCHSDSCKKNRANRRGGDVITFVAVRENCEPYEACRMLLEWFPMNGNKSTPQKAERCASVSEKADAGVLPKPTEPVAENKPLGFPGFKDVDSTHGYLQERGIRITTAEEFGVGFYSGKSTVIKDPYRIVIPIHNPAGELIAYVGRSLDPGVKDKYHFPSGFHKSLELFNLHRVTSEAVIVVEGFFGSMRLHQAGFPNVVALMGRTLGEAQLCLLERFKRVVLMLDGDSPGREATEAIVPKIAARCFVRSIFLKDGEEPDRLPPEELQRLLAPALAGAFLS
jgi:Toprim domain/DNA primase catalytic core, N-terminal domain/CHC2 zinc finger